MHVPLTSLDSKPLIEFLCNLSKIIKNIEKPQIWTYSSTNDVEKLSLNDIKI